MKKTFWLEILKAEEHLGELSVDGKLMLKRVTKNRLPSYGLQSSRWVESSVLVAREYENRELVRKKAGNFLVLQRLPLYT
jgi:hypothetical protein